MEVWRLRLLCARQTHRDVLGEIGRGRGYEELLARSHELDIADGLRVRVLDLEAYIELKQELGSKKNLAALPLLRRPCAGAIVAAEGRRRVGPSRPQDPATLL